MESEQESIALPDYYEDVVKGAQHITHGSGLTLSTEGGCFQKYVTSKPEADEDGEKKVSFLDSKGKVTIDVRSAVAVLVDSGGASSAVFFKERFCQPLPPPDEAPARPSGEDFIRSFINSNYIPQPPLMSNWQAEQLAHNPATYIDGKGRFRMG